MKILAEISTKNRYFSTLPLTINSIISQTVRPDKLVIYDDGDQIDLRKEPLYQYIFKMLDAKSIDWEVFFGEKRGQHFNHEKARLYAIENGYDLVWRLDDDEIAEYNCLEKLLSCINSDVMAVGGLVIDPNNYLYDLPKNASSRLLDIYDCPNVQWFQQPSKKSNVEHLYSSFLFRPKASKYDLNLSPVAHREETIFTHKMLKKGRLVFYSEALTWHFRYPEGGIRDKTDKQMWQHDENVFINYMPVAILDNGLGDHIVFRKLLDDYNIKNIIIFCCYPEVFEGFKCLSIQQAKDMLGNINNFNLYKFMIDNNHKEDLYKAYEKLYNITSFRS